MRVHHGARAAIAWALWGVVAQAFFVGPAVGADDPITSWNQYLLANVVKPDNRNPPAGPGDKPPAVSRQLAMIHAAMFDAVNTVEQQYTPYNVQPTGYTGANAELAA